MAAPTDDTISPRRPFDVHRFLIEREINDKVQAPLSSAERLWEFLNDESTLSPFRFHDGLALYRGQSNGAYGVNSSLYRLAQNEIDSIATLRGSKNQVQKKLAEQVLSQVESEVLREARANGIGAAMTGLETLSLLQHHLSPTRLMDVSYSPLAALYFAIERNQWTDGRLFLFTTRKSQSLTADDMGKDLDNGLPWTGSNERIAASGWQDRVWHFPVAPLDARMWAQQGTFLAGGLFSTGGDYQQFRGVGNTTGPGRQDVLTAKEFRRVCTLAISFPRQFPGVREESRWDAYGWSISIPKEWKEPLRVLLEAAGVTKDSIYPPVDDVRRLLTRVASDEAKRALERFRATV
ncbi:FRG domain-containing protein [Cryobacterium zhongshanensis]|uniref:FRG domain-containing protein n=1 Tax=Cryobacterium zhongshanensis TaxID=2928153 RepID=A0AA41QYT5_9MICO|nr:FRG domain-containing protein [Cryobacterium zhongshanensis]MCI4658933.1 FRG domain-containing protein [Cryobacterium zhongshanensis]